MNKQKNDADIKRNSMKDSLNDTKNKLDAVSPSFCVAKWKQVTIHLENGTTHSCHHVPVHKVPLSELSTNPSALHNTAFKKEQRKKMLEGVRPEECDYCWRVEDIPSNTYSDRHTKSDREWAKPHIDTIKMLPWDHNITPSYLEASFSNVCNFKCSYCSPSFSSKWMEEIKQHGVYPTGQYNLEWLEKDGRTPIPVREHNPYVEAFWKWWPEIYSDLHVFRITGGEPLMSKDTFRVLDYIIAHPNPTFRLAVNTNLGVPDELLNKFIEKIQFIAKNKLVEKIEIYTSVEGWGDRAAYIRHGMVFDKFMSNVERVLKEIPECDLTFMCAFNALSVTSFKQFLEKAYDLKMQYNNEHRPHGIFIDAPYLRYPCHQCVDVLPEEYMPYMEEILEYITSRKEPFKGKIRGFHPHEINHIQRIHDLMAMREKDTKAIAGHRADFYRFFVEHDRRRGTDFLKTFPEMKDFWELAKKEAEPK